jgi:hypothetical protein
MLRKIGFTLLGFIAFAAAALVVYGMFSGLGYVGLRIPYSDLVDDRPLFANGAIFAFMLLMLTCIVSFLVLIVCAVSRLAYAAGHLVADWFVQQVSNKPQQTETTSIQPAP